MASRRIFTAVRAGLAPWALVLCLPMAPAWAAPLTHPKTHTPHEAHAVPGLRAGAPQRKAVPVEQESPVAEVPEAAPPVRIAHDVPPAQVGDTYEVPIAWVVGDGRPHHRPQAASLTLGIWPDSFTLGAWWAVPVLPRGFIRNVNDSLDIEFGLMLGAMRNGYYWQDAATSWQLWPAVGAKWNFFLTRNWTTFATLKLAGRIPLAGPHPGWFDILLGAGATYRIKERMHLRLELNYPQGAVVGLSFPIGTL